MTLSFPNHLGDCSYSFQRSVEVLCITVTVSLLFLQNAVTEKYSRQGFSGLDCNTVT